MSRHLRRRAALRSIPLALGPAAARLERALQAPEAAQDRLRRQIAASAARTAYGRSVGVRGPADFHRLPVATYDALAPWLDRQRRDEGRVVVSEPVRFYERTSGSSGRAKYIPYTAPLRGAFSEMFAAWAHDVLRNGPKLRTGKVYVSVSPSLGAAEVTARGRKVGLEDDAAYLDGWLQRLLAPFLVQLPPSQRHADAGAFKDALAARLVQAPELEVVSVWNPSFLEVILDHIQAHGDRLSRLPGLSAARRGALRSAEIDWRAVWPGLKLVSCWDQGPAAPMAARLRARLGGVTVQGKGLLATEAPVTIPWIPAGACVPLVHRTLIELLDADGRLLPLTAARLGARYELVLSVPGGLCRYRIGDQVEVTGIYKQTPCLAFVGRTSGVCDLVGEKLQEQFVAGVLQRHAPGDRMATLVPLSGPPAGYVLLSDRALPAGAAAAVDRALSEAHHYGLARGLGQLAPLRAVAAPEAARWVAEREMRRGLRWGDIKPRALQPRPADPILSNQLAGA